MDKPSKEKDNSFATPKVSLQPFLPEFGVTAGCNSLGGGGEFLRPRPACFA